MSPNLMSREACCIRASYPAHITPASGNFISVADNHGGWLTYHGKTLWEIPCVGGNILTQPNRVDVHAVNLEDIRWVVLCWIPSWVSGP